MNVWDLKLKERRESFKPKINSSQMKQKRLELTISLSKKKKEKDLMKRRKVKNFNEMEAEPFSRLYFEMNQGIEGKKKNDLMILSEQIKILQKENIKTHITQIRKLLSSPFPPINEVIELNLIPIFLSILKENFDEQIKLEVIWCLINISSGTSEQTNSIIKENGIEVLFEFISNHSGESREQCFWIIGNIVADSINLRDLILQKGITQIVIQMIEESNGLVNDIQTASWMLSNLLRGNPIPNLNFFKPYFLYFESLLYFNDKKTLFYTCSCILIISSEKDQINLLFEENIPSQIIRLLKESPNEIIYQCLQIIDNLLKGNQTQIDSLFESDLLKNLNQLLFHSDQDIKKKTCLTISTLANQNQQNIQKLFENDIVSSILKMLENETFELQKETLSIFYGIINQSNQQQSQLFITDSFIGLLIKLISVDDTESIYSILEIFRKLLEISEKIAFENGISNTCVDFLEEVGGIEIIEKLQNHMNYYVSQIAKQIINNYSSNYEEMNLENSN
ncbi:importin alpha [Anaeramoeba ignava]|uniref:Importin subunit alpha n=1 Tax=Anaeramoeba ignava TaxID=1746090 RepID=A0A9Q0LRE4_ANAIG|nr:importin alpha [Anaeramoeba ignava]